MATSTVEIELPLVLEVVVTDDTLTVELDDGRTLSVPLAWYPRLVHGSAEAAELAAELLNRSVGLLDHGSDHMQHAMHVEGC